MSPFLSLCLLLALLLNCLGYPNGPEVKRPNNIGMDPLRRKISTRGSFTDWDAWPPIQRIPEKKRKNTFPEADSTMKYYRPDEADERWKLASQLDQLRLGEDQKRGLSRFNPGPWSSISVDYSKMIGGGSFGKVFLGHSPYAPHNVVAVKQIDYVNTATAKRKKKERILKHIYEEAQICGSVNHINLLQCAPDYRLDERNGFAYLVFEYCDAGDLMSLIVRRSLSEDEAQCAFYQMMQGLDYLHRNNIVHADIKAENMFLQSNGLLKIGDYGLSNRIPRGQQVGGLRGTSSYYSPEMFTADANRRQYFKTYTRDPRPAPPYVIAYDPFAADIWAAGLTYVASRLSGRPWNRSDLTDVNYRSFTANPVQFLNNIAALSPEKLIFSEEELNLILAMLEIDPNKRVAASQVMEMEWYQSLFDKCPDEVQSSYLISELY